MHEPAWPIETARLLLRPFLASDLEALHAIHGDEENVRWLYNDARTLEETVSSSAQDRGSALRAKANG